MWSATLDPALELPVHVVEVVAVYAGRVFDVRHFARGAYTVGDDPRASFPLIASMLAGSVRFPLVCRRAGVIVLRFTADMHGVLAGGDERSSLDELITSGRATAIDGAFTVALLADEHAVVNVGAVSFALRSVPAARRPAFSSGLRWEWWTHALVMFMVLGTLLLMAQRRPNLIGDVGSDAWPAEPRFVGFVHRPRAEETVRDRIALPPPRPPADGESRHSGERGKQGKPFTRSTQGRLAIARRPGPSGFHTRNFNPEEVQVHGGLLGLYESRLGYFLVSPHGGAHRKSELAARELWGRRGRREGEARGVGGLGVRGTGRGGGGRYEGGALDGAGGGMDGVRLLRTGRAWRDLGVIGPLALADVRRIVGWRKAALRRCGSLGAATLDFTINGAGRVTNVTVMTAGPRETRAAGCVARHIRRMWFPLAVGSLRVRYPLPEAAPIHEP